MEHVYSCNEPIIEGLDSTNSKYLYSLFAAIKCVSKDYIRYTHHNENPKSISASKETIERSNDEISHVERVFAYELYRQWCDQYIIRNSFGLVINAELPKQLTDKIYNEGCHLYYPDMVLHSGQDEFKNNHIICEIKRKEYVDSYPEKMNDDIKKLCIYVNDETRLKDENIDWNSFKLGVFLMTIRELKKHEKEEYSLDLIYKYLSQDILNLEDRLTKKIVCAIYNGDELKYDTLYNMINKK